MVAMIDVQGNRPPEGASGWGGGPANFGDTGGWGDFFSNNSGVLGGLGMAGALGGALALGGAGGGIPYGGQIQNVIDQSGALTIPASTGYGNAQTLFGEGQQLINPLITGQLPAGAEQAIQNELRKSQGISAGTFSRLGLGGSTMAGDARAALENQTAAQRFAIEQGMANTGVQVTQLANTALSQATQALETQLGIQMKGYQSLAELQMKQDQGMMSTIASFAGSFGKMMGAAGGASSLASLLPLLAV